MRRLADVFELVIDRLAQGALAQENLIEHQLLTKAHNGVCSCIPRLNNPSTSNLSIGRAGALAALRDLRPDPSVTQVEELQSRGNSYYHGVSFEAQRRLTRRGFLRASYTLSKLIDDGVVNTSSPLVVGDFRRERALSLQDARHRVAISGVCLFPAWLARLNLSGTFNYGSSSPFSIGVRGNDRNLDDVNNDRPNFTGDIDRIVWRRPGEPLDPALAAAFSLPTIGSAGNLPRNAGRGPSAYKLNLRLAREFKFNERNRAELQVEAFNPFNATQSCPICKLLKAAGL